MIDAHCHFDFSVFDPDREAIWARCQSFGVEQLIIPGVAPAAWAKMVTLTERLPGIWMAVGIHPWWVGELPQTLADAEYQRWLDLLNHPRCVAIGECGLDSAIDIPLSSQQPWFEKQLAMACEYQLPVVIHVRKTHHETLALLKRFKPPAGGMIHGFSGSLEQALDYWRLGFYIGVGGVITYERAAKTRRAIAALPMEALLLETDAPDMPLASFQGSRNSPEQLPMIAQTLATLRSQSLDDVIAQTTANAKRLFQL